MMSKQQIGYVIELCWKQLRVYNIAVLTNNSVSLSLCIATVLEAQTTFQVIESLLCDYSRNNMGIVTNRTGNADAHLL